MMETSKTIGNNIVLIMAKIKKKVFLRTKNDIINVITGTRYNTAPLI